MSELCCIAGFGVLVILVDFGGCWGVLLFCCLGLLYLFLCRVLVFGYLLVVLLIVFSRVVGCWFGWFVLFICWLHVCLILFVCGVFEFTLVCLVGCGVVYNVECIWFVCLIACSLLV